MDAEAQRKKREKNYLFKVNPDLALHVWEGHCRTHSDSQIFKGKWEVRDFEIEEHFDGPYLGADWGFSRDPTVITKSYLDLKKNYLYIRYAKFGYGVELPDLPKMFDQVPESRKFKIRADNSRPETISYIRKYKENDEDKRPRFDIEGALKWKGSVEDGVEWLKGFKIIIHPSCEEMIKEAKNYSYKTDRLTKDVLTDIVDAFNHGWDSIRYAFQPMISSGIIGDFSKEFLNNDEDENNDDEQAQQGAIW